MRGLPPEDEADVFRSERKEDALQLEQDIYAKVLLRILRCSRGDSKPTLDSQECDLIIRRLDNLHSQLNRCQEELELSNKKIEVMEKYLKMNRVLGVWKELKELEDGQKRKDN